MWRSAQYVKSEPISSIDGDDWDTDPDFVVRKQWNLSLCWVIIGILLFVLHIPSE